MLRKSGGRVGRAVSGDPWRWLVAGWAGCLLMGRVFGEENVPDAIIRSYLGVAEVARSGATTWDPARTNQAVFRGDRLRTGEHSRLTLVLRDGSVVHLNEFTTTQLGREDRRSVFDLLRGVMSFFHRDEPATLEVRGRGVSALVRGTEFVFAVDPEGRVDLRLLDGEVGVTNSLGGVGVSGEGRVTVLPGAAPTTATLVGSWAEAVQWLLYYPAVLVPSDLPRPAADPGRWETVIRRLESGDLPGALGLMPAPSEGDGGEVRVLRAALLISVGSVEQARAELDRVGGEGIPERLAEALRGMVAAVQGRPLPELRAAASATEWLAASYGRQARGDLPGALEAALQAVHLAPGSGSAWARVAELEFSFGRIRRMEPALERARAFSPRNPQVLVLQGFAWAAAQRLAEAEEAFQAALALDSRLGNAWLGRGLIRIRRGDLDRGREDLTLAAALEPQRALLRSYLGKVYATGGDLARAEHELGLARRLDAWDPTAWLYLALLHQQRGHLNAALRAYAEAESRNESRALYRSRLLLDQDRAVAKANRAAAFRDAGLLDFGVREASRALAEDPSNPSAHLFLAESYLNGERINLRYETPRVSEYLQANLLSPVGAGVLSPNLSQQDYSRLLEQDGWHVFSGTTYRSSGAWEQNGGLSGSDRRLGYLADAYYLSDPGFASNTDVEQTAGNLQLQVQTRDRDTLYLHVLQSSMVSGDLANYADPESRNPHLRVEETLEPILLAGWHRAWSPEHHTLVLGSWLRGVQRQQDGAATGLLFSTNGWGQVDYVLPVEDLQASYRSAEEWLSGEVEHLWRADFHSLVAGFRAQQGSLDVQQEFDGLPADAQAGPSVAHPAADRWQGYAYETVRPWAGLALTAGFSYDVVRFPLNHRRGPVSDESLERSQLGPKLGGVWNPVSNLWVRAGYARSLGGVSFEQSFRLEPTQVAGFNQAFRSLIPESVAGALSGARFETWQGALETRWGGDTFLAVQADLLQSDLRNDTGVYQGDFFAGSLPRFTAGQTPVQWDYREKGLSFSAARLLGRYFSAYLRYRLVAVELDQRWLEVSDEALVLGSGVGPLIRREVELHRLEGGVRFNHPSGCFAGWDAQWFWQPARPESGVAAEDTGQLGLFAGYRLWQRRAEAVVGLENLAGQDHRLDPLGGWVAWPRERILYLRFKWYW